MKACETHVKIGDSMARSLSNPTVAHAPKPVVKEKDRDPVAAGKRAAAFNRSASFNYFLTDKFEAGVALRGTEVKSIREGKANLKDAYGLLKDGECFLLNAHIGPFSHGNAMNHDSLRTRKLLLHKSEVRKLEGMTKQKGFTLIPTRLYFRNGRVKCELALAKGKQGWDKRATERKRGHINEPSPAVARSQRRKRCFSCMAGWGEGMRVALGKKHGHEASLSGCGGIFYPDACRICRRYCDGQGC